MDGVTEWKEYRNYEVSVWTLQDSYITTLKSGDSIYVANQPAVVWPQARAQGQIQDGEMVLNIDGTQTLTFDIPMYLFYNGQKIENPNWYNVINKNILTSMRKIKVIFDKWDGSDKSDKTFEFMIIKVQETHEKDELKCHVECEGLAFNELGKVGYKKSLSAQKFINESYEWANAKVGQGETYATQADKDAAEPVSNLQYWMNEAGIEPLPNNENDINPTQWYYKIEMSYSSMEHKENTISSEKIYEYGYPSDWNENGVPINYVETREKYRLIDIEESNLYNITQDLAEKFGVFCRYKYLYDNNYNIIGRIIIFYNNFLQEEKDVTTLMYPNSASKVTREMDSTDVSTKMYVRQVEAADLYDGIISIMDCDANKTREDYVMNFDYLHDIGTISDEQYAEIPEFEKAVRKINDQLIPLQESYNNLINLKTNIEAQIKILETAKTLDQEEYNKADDLLAALDIDGDGNLSKTQANPDILYLIKDEENVKAKFRTSYYVQFNDAEKLGIDPSSIRLFKTRNSTSQRTYSWGISFKKFSKPTNSRIVNSKVPRISGDNWSGSADGWVDYEFIYKGTLGTNGDITSLPVSGPARKGFVYKIINDTATYDEIECKKGDILYCTGKVHDGWAKLSIGSGKPDNGFYIYKRENVRQLNGQQTNIYTCTRCGAKNTTTDFISRMEYVYNTVEKNATAPSTPVAEDVKTKGTKIESGEILNAWTTYLSLPNDDTAVDIYSSKELMYNSGKKIFLPSRKVSQTYEYYGTGSSINDSKTEPNILSDEITKFTIQYVNKSKIIDKITGLFNKKTPTVNYIYAIYNYRPQDYYQELKCFWKEKFNKDKEDYDNYTDQKDKLDILIENAQTNINICIEDKQKLITRFEHIMGAALRESYWQPENEYQDYGKRYIENLPLSDATSINLNNGTFASIFWDEVGFADEEKLYYTSGVSEDKIYYPCIDLSSFNGFKAAIYEWLLDTSEDKENPSCFFLTNDSAQSNNNEIDPRYCKQFILGSGAKLIFVNDDGTIKPALLLTGASSLTDSELGKLQTDGKLGLLKLEENEETDDLIFKIIGNAENIRGKLITSNNDNPTIVYPRIFIPSLRLKTSNLTVQLSNNALLEQFVDYSINTKTFYKNGNNYNDIENIDIDHISEDLEFLMGQTITIKPEAFFKNNLDYNVKIYYTISNAATDIYLDALKIMKENAYPKVSYEIDVSMWSRTLLKNLYQKLAQIVMINDTDLKLKDTFGYISEIKLDLDHQENDTIDVKNYKTKFEDLFSKIVAETEEMHKNSYNLDMIGAFMSGDSISQNALDNTLSDSDNQNVLKNYLDDYLKNSDTLPDILSSLWTQAGEILSDSVNSFNNLSILNNQNASILNSFREDVSAALTPRIFKGNEQPMVFKPGDIWINGDYYGVATGYSGKGGGFTRTHDGSLAQISGASFDMDAEAGIIDINAGTQINLRSGEDINIAAYDTVNIIGNKEVNIGGTTINIASANIVNNNVQEIGSGGIHLVATTYNYSTADDTSTDISDDDIDEDNHPPIYEQEESYSEQNDGISYVDITGNGIEMASRNGIVIKSGAGIDIKSSNDTDTSAVQIDKDKGIWLGSDKGISLFSGTMGQNASAASIELNPTHLLLGVSSTSNANATVIEMTQEGMVIGAGSNLATIRNNTDINLLNVAGFKISSNYIGMATATATENNITTHSIVSISPTAVLIGSSQVQSGAPTGSYVSITTDGIITKSGASQISIAPNGITISSDGNLIMNANSGAFKIDSSATGPTDSLYIATTNNWSNASSGIRYSAVNGLEIKGNVTANSFTIAGVQPFDSSGKIDASSVKNLSTGLTTNDLKKLNVSSNGLEWSSDLNGQPALVVGSTGNLQVATNGTLTIASGGNLSILSGGNIGIASGGTLTVNTSNVIINTSAGNNETIFSLTNGRTGNNLETFFNITRITSTKVSAKLGPWTIMPTYICDSDEGATSHVGMRYSSSSTNKVAFYAGAPGEGDDWTYTKNLNASKFRVTHNGDVYINSLMVYDPDNKISGAHTSSHYVSVDFSNNDTNNSYPLWKLYGQTITGHTENSITLSDGTTVDFNTAAGVTLKYITITRVAQSGGGYSVTLNYGLSNNVGETGKTYYYSQD